jgi:hypothetical protein
VYGAIVLTLAGCAGSSLTPPAEPPSNVGGLTPTTTTVITAEDVAAEAVDSEALSGILDVAGFQAGVRRAYAGNGRAIRRVEVGILSFESNDGASTYLAWLRANVADLIGEVRSPDKTFFGGRPAVRARTRRLLSSRTGGRPCGVEPGTAGRPCVGRRRGGRWPKGGSTRARGP